MELNTLQILSALSLLLVGLYIGGAMADSSRSTENGAIVRGGVFNLKCASENRVCGALQWLKRSVTGLEDAISYGRVLVSDQNGRYTTNSSGIPCDVTVNNVQMSDAGEFACESPDKGKQSAFLAVLDSPPRCWHSSYDGLVVEGEHLSVHCSLDRYLTNSEVKLEWLDEKRQEIRSVATSQRPDTVNSSFIITARSPVIYPFTCKASFLPRSTRNGAARNVPEVSCMTEQIRVVYPVRDIRLKMNGTRLTSGKKVTCLADGEPRPTIYWVTLTTGGVTYSDVIWVREDHVYQCVASNVIRGKRNEEKSWEIYVLNDPTSPATSTTSTTTTSTTTSMTTPTTTPTPTTTTSIPSTHTTLVQEERLPQDESYVIDSYDDVIDKQKHDVINKEEKDEPNSIIQKEKVSEINLSALILGVSLIVSFIIIVILLIFVCRLNDKVKQIKQPNDADMSLLTSRQATTMAAARQIMTPVESNGFNHAGNINGTKKHPDILYSPISSPPIRVGNGQIHDDVYLDVNKRT